MAGWTADDIPWQKGRVAVVTGANSGLGYCTAQELAVRGAKVLLACRSPERGMEAVRRLRAREPDIDVEYRPLDLADLASVRAFAAELDMDRLDLLINNAGIGGVPFGRTAEGFETHLGTNHVGHFALTGLLLPRLLATPGSRVITVSSVMHFAARCEPDDLQGQRRFYQRWLAYGRSKTANLLFTHELSRRLSAAGATTVAAAAHPGYAATGLQRNAVGQNGPRLLDRLLVLGNRFVARPPEAGALPTLYAATCPAVGQGVYIGPGSLTHTLPVSARRAPWARDARRAKALWEASERLSGVKAGI
ncbi:SDR family NAD(P)-dependent oxidoreductase [Streptomyces ipomoeae]|uniref:Dehydrogenase n=2 Tax=Streptomyces ipomoeae TaxID=103232 RepID=I3P646_9ACTN|nr:oxidoreductase [Streptomyces ipomoeae]AEL30536.1 dehydrogenase [Streptomyces ipomoeae 91-03]EKX60302.1 oxidoreductase, short chain dehydrogenase/reductase family protein [Streptomyces ipomoeae 91-03]MDX2700519.1 oxidoreductase [Streptomyces ipomoeae]MDX2827763.1 oxidoreductase [Streptomyces ipomoeae]MDX2846169.1 oxidoreductase [Streptomyces ipomoeae]